MLNKVFFQTLAFGDPIVSKIMRLEALKASSFRVSIPPHLFKIVFKIYDMLESIGSARIEGNHTTVSAFLEAQSTGTESDEIQEILNIQKALAYIRESYQNASFKMTEFFLKELHQLTVFGLQREGSQQPGVYRNHQVHIQGSDHIPPDAVIVPEEMTGLVAFINEDSQPQEKIFKVAQAHHQFSWIHPFDNGNGRMARLLSYAMLCQYGFNHAHWLNPSAVFCDDRQSYYRMLAKADSGDIYTWADYVISGLLAEYDKLCQLSSLKVLKLKVLNPLFTNLKLSDEEIKIVDYFTVHSSAKISDLHELGLNKTATQLTYILRKLKGRGLLEPESENGRLYHFSMEGPEIQRRIIKILRQEGFIGLRDEDA